jgi:hypothetical protein
VFFIHGGYFRNGYGGENGPDYWYREGILPSRYNRNNSRIDIVTFNYRLSILGFYPLRTYSDELSSDCGNFAEIGGSLGVDDAIKAFIYTQRLYASDSNVVFLVMGQSAGAMLAHLIAPHLQVLSGGVLENFVLMSGLSTMPAAFHYSALQIIEHTKNMTNCTDLPCLKRSNPETIMKLVHAGEEQEGAPAGLNDWYLPHLSRTIQCYPWHSARLHNRMRIMVTLNQNELGAIVQTLLNTTDLFPSSPSSSYKKGRTRWGKRTNAAKYRNSNRTKKIIYNKYNAANDTPSNETDMLDLIPHFKHLFPNTTIQNLYSFVIPYGFNFFAFSLKEVMASAFNDYLFVYSIMTLPKVSPHVVVYVGFSSTLGNNLDRLHEQPTRILGHGDDLSAAFCHHATSDISTIGSQLIIPRLCKGDSGRADLSYKMLRHFVHFAITNAPATTTWKHINPRSNCLSMIPSCPVYSLSQYKPKFYFPMLRLKAWKKLFDQIPYAKY